MGMDGPYLRVSSIEGCFRHGWSLPESKNNLNIKMSSFSRYFKLQKCPEYNYRGLFISGSPHSYLRGFHCTENLVSLELLCVS